MKNKLDDISRYIIERFHKDSIFNCFIMLYCSFMIYCPPYFTNYLPSNIKTPLRLIGISFILFLYFFYTIYKKRISKLFVFTFIMCLYFFVICIVNGNDYFYALYSNFFMTISAISLFEIYTNSELKLDFIKINYFLWLISIFIFVLVYLSGYENLESMYNRNNYIMFIFIYILFEKQLMLMDNNKIYKIISYIMSVVLILFSIATGAATASVVLIVIYIYEYILDRNDIYKKVFDGFNIYAIVLLLYFMLMIFPGTHSPFANFVSQLFHKEESWSWRSMFYDIDRDLFMKRPIFLSILSAALICFSSYFSSISLVSLIILSSNPYKI